MSGTLAGTGDNASVADGAHVRVVAGPYNAIGGAEDFPTAVVALNLHLPGALTGLQGEVRFAQFEAVRIGVDPGVALHLDLTGGGLLAAGSGDSDGAARLAGNGAAVYGSNLRVGGAPGYGAAAAGGGDPPRLACGDGDVRLGQGQWPCGFRLYWICGGVRRAGFAAGGFIRVSGR